MLPNLGLLDIGQKKTGLIKTIQKNVCFDAFSPLGKGVIALTTDYLKKSMFPKRLRNMITG